jgi:hypothetical protein
MLKATVIGGGLFGLAGGLPLVGALNCLCCSLFIGGGFVAAYLYSRDCSAQGFTFRAGNGALVGLVSGLFYAIGTTLAGTLVAMVMGGPDVDTIVDQMEQAGAPPEFVDTMIRVMDMLEGPSGILVQFFAALLLAAVFCTIGGLIGGAVFKIEAPPPASPGAGVAPPPPPPPANP